VRVARPEADSFDYPFAAIAHNTPKEPRGAFVVPGLYRVRLTVGGRSLLQPLTVKMDPRVKVTAADLALQFSLSKTLTDAMHNLAAAEADVKTRPAAADRPAAGDAAKTLAEAHALLTPLFTALQGADARPTAAQEAAVKAAVAKTDAAIAAAKDVR
jgi:hypothetical protein